MILLLVLYRCSSTKSTTTINTQKWPDTADLSKSPVVPALQSLKRMAVEPGMEVKLLAAEPLLSTPVAMTFDNRGRMWVVEMASYMPDTLGTGEDVPNGKIVLLTDANNDGTPDKRQVVIDSLKMPRAICLINGGILVAEPPNLWFYSLNDDKPAGRTLVDAHYTGDGNVEHYPNGLYRALDNWIYNAKSSKRYRYKNGKWLIENTHFRGQWGISQDNYGRLYYNDNSTNVQGDYFPPGLGAGNPDQSNVAGYYERIVADNRVYPARPTPGVNRGYTTGTLDDSLRLVNFTAACSPLIYRGSLLYPEVAGQMNAFVAEPSANLIKRNILHLEGNAVKGKEAYKGREFLASTDERFRPVFLTDGPDGALYVVDMYRGIIQHKTYLTDYLKGQIKKRGLEVNINCGRLYKVYPKGSQLRAVTIPTDAAQLVALLGNKNGRVRDKAQQTLIDGKYTQAIPALRQALKSGSNTLQRVHALWALEGLDALTMDDDLIALRDTARILKVQGYAAIPSVLEKGNYAEKMSEFLNINYASSEQNAPYIALLNGYVYPHKNKIGKLDVVQNASEMALRYRNNRYVVDAIISTIPGHEDALLNDITKKTDTNSVLYKRLASVIKHRNDRLKNRNPETLKKEFPKGAAIFASTCQTCHGPDGNGITSLAPPLNRSQWVNGDKTTLLSIVLAGLTGPVEVNGHVYKAPEVAGDMPGIGNNTEFSDEDIAQLLSFIRRSWQNDADKVQTAEVTTMRTKLKSRQKAFTVPELKAQK